MVERTIPQLIILSDNEYLARIPQSEEVNNIVHNMDDNFASDLDGFKDFFLSLLRYSKD